MQAQSNQVGLQTLSPQTYRTGAWVGIASIVMLFTGLSSAYVVRSGSSTDWQALSAPRALWISTSLILVSSLTFEIARRALKRRNIDTYNRWLFVTAILGLCFLAAQFMAWRQLVARGIYLVSNPHSSFFFVLTGAHGVHLLGGILALNYLMFRAWRRNGGAWPQDKKEAVTDAVAIYWHFMDGLWVYLFLLLFLWR